jgi:hypothetical protein
MLMLLPGSPEQLHVGHFAEREAPREPATCNAGLRPVQPTGKTRTVRGHTPDSHGHE